MWEKIWKYRREIILIILIIIAISMIAHNSLNPSRSLTSKILLSILYPFQKVVHYISYQFEKLFDFAFKIKNLYRENARLQSELKILKHKCNQLTEENIQLKQLTKLSEFIEEHKHQYLPASIIGISPSPMSNLIIINKGERDNIEMDMCVISEDGLIGKIKQVSPHSSLVLILSDKRSVVSAITQDTRERGIVIGKDLINEYTFIPENPVANLTVGQEIITSGLGGSIYPTGIPIGEIVKIQKAKYGIYFADIKSSVDLSKLETVLIVTESRTTSEENKNNIEKNGSQNNDK